jgi:uncharacterized protein YecT (DUF1311 family)
MRAILLAIVAIQVVVGLEHPACAQGSTETDRSISETLPLFGKNRCEEFKAPADQIICGDPELNDASARLKSAIQDRLNRLSDRRLAIAENAEWIRDRNSSCGIFGKESLRSEEVKPVKACLLKEMEERVAILEDPNFDCLATNTTAGALICSDPSLAQAEMELNGHVLGLITKLNENDARDAFTEYARWTRARDRRCDLVDKDNVPLQELSSSEVCLAEYLRQKTEEVLATNGDPKRIFGRHSPSLSPDADAVDLCVAQIHSANTCEDFLRVHRVLEIDREVAAQDAVVTAEVEMVVLSPFAACSSIASGCTGTCWNLKSGKAEPTPGSRDSFAVAHRVKIEKSFAFQKTDAGSWRCNSTALAPVDLGIALSGP